MIINHGIYKVPKIKIIKKRNRKKITLYKYQSLIKTLMRIVVMLVHHYHYHKINLKMTNCWDLLNIIKIFLMLIMKIT
jgi:hypothetical protein